MTWDKWGKIKNLGTARKTSAHFCKLFFLTGKPALNCSQEWGGEGLGRLNEAWGGKASGYFRIV